MTIAQRVARLHADVETSQKARDFVTICKALTASGGWGAAIRDHQNFNIGPTVLDLMKRTAVAPNSMVSASPLAETGLVAAFVASLRNIAAFDTMLPSMTRVPFKTKIAVTTLGATGAVIGEDQAKPISRLTLAGAELEPLKAVAMIVTSDELARSLSPDAMDLFGRELRGAVAAATDRQFLAILTAGISPFASTGSTAAAARADLRTLLQSVAVGSASTLFWLTTSSIAKALSAIADVNGSAAFPNARWNGGSIFGIPLVVSDEVTAGRIVLVDATGLAAGSLDVELSSARHTTLQLDDAPDSPPTAATAPVNLWQRNLVAMKAERWFGAERLRADAVAVVENVAFVGNSPA